MPDAKPAESDFFLTQNANIVKSLEHLPHSLILFRARLAAIESGKSKLVTVKTFDLINFEGLLIADRFIIFTPTGELKTHTDKKELNTDPDIVAYDLFYEIRSKKNKGKKKLQEQ